MLQLVLWSAALGLLAWWALGLLRGGLWARLGIPEEKGWPLIGSYGRFLAEKASISEIVSEIYRKHPDKPFVGFYEFNSPALLIRDPELAKNIETRDFSSFHDNYFPIDDKVDPLFCYNLFFMKGERWKKKRAQVSPAYSTGHLRSFLPELHNIAQELVDYVRAEAPASLPDGLDVKELAAKYMTDMTSSVGLGVSANSFKDPDAEIRAMCREFLLPDAWNSFLFSLSSFVPVVNQLFLTRIVSQKADRFFRKLVEDTVRQRAEKGIVRNDFLQLLLDLKQKAKERGETFDDNEVVAHCTNFFFDNTEMSASTLAFLLHDLAGSPEKQRRLREELKTLPKDDPEAVLRLPYLNACLMESLRLAPPLGLLPKLSTAAVPLRLPGGGEATLPAGSSVVIPLWALQTDAEHFPDPRAFRPERFLEAEGGGREGGAPPGAYLPFGLGPRQCIGMRLSQISVKVAAAALLQAFEVKRTPRSPRDPMKMDPKNFMLAPKGGFWLRFEPLAPA